MDGSQWQIVGQIVVLGTIAGAILQLIRLNSAMKEKGREEQKLSDSVDRIGAQLNDISHELKLLSAVVHELQIENQKEHGELVGKIRDVEKNLSERLIKLEASGCSPVKKGA